MHARSKVIRRTMDITGAALGLLLVGPLPALAALLVWLEDRGPLLYRRRVLGRGGDLGGCQLASHAAQHPRTC